MLTRVLNTDRVLSSGQDQGQRFFHLSGTRSLGSRAPLTVGIVTAVVYLLLGSTWAFSSPVFSLPDEYSHAVKAAAVVRGDIIPTSKTVGEWVTVPSWLNTASWVCFAGHSEVTAHCQTPMTHSNSLTAQKTYAGRYPPFYYALVGWPTLLFAGSSAFYAQRELTVLLSALLLGLAAWSASSAPNNCRVLLALGVAITPMTIYFMGGVNPQAPEITAAVGVWISGWALLQNRREFNRGALTRFTISACALALCRPLSALWLTVIVASLLIGFSQASHWTVFRQSLPAKICAGTVLLASLTQMAWVASTGALTQSTLGVHMSTVDAIVESMSRQFSWLVQMIGFFGWLDTMSWPPVYVVWLVAATCLVITALRLGTPRERLALALVIAGSMAIPTIAEVATRDQTGFAWQGRYTLPLSIGVILSSGMIASRRFRSRADGRSWDHVARIVIVPMVGAAHFFAWSSALKRYGSGASSGFPFGDDVIKWAPPGGTWMWVSVMGFASVLFTVWLLWVTAAGPDDELSSLNVVPTVMAVPVAPRKTLSSIADVD